MKMETVTHKYVQMHFRNDNLILERKVSTKNIYKGGGKLAGSI